jgi:hypothetical protein
VRTAALAVLLALAGACTPGAAPPEPGDAPPSPRPSGAPSGLSAFPGREAVISAGARAADRGPHPPATADPAALAELIAAAPDAVQASTGKDGGTEIGTDTGLRAEPPVLPPDPPEPRPARVSVGEVKVQTEMSTPAIEKMARAQLYWPLVQRCRDPAGAILPPESITLSFTIDIEGYIVPSSIVSTPSDPRHEEAAACMRRELAGAPFRAPPSARGLLTRVDALVPSMD